jgi:hypothetical protein
MAVPGAALGLGQECRCGTALRAAQRPRQRGRVDGVLLFPAVYQQLDPSTLRATRPMKTTADRKQDQRLAVLVRRVGAENDIAA